MSFALHLTAFGSLPHGAESYCVICLSVQCFSTAGPRPGTGPWHQLHQAARHSPGMCHFSFL